MKKKILVPLAALAVAAAVLVPALPAAADIIQDYRSCPSGYTVTTGSYTAAGTVSHFHGSSAKTWTNTGFQWRYYDAGYRATNWSIVRSSGVITSWSTTCLN